MDPDKFYLKNFPGKFYQTSEEEPVLILPRYFQTIEEVRAHPNAFCEASIPQIPKTDTVGKKNYKPISLVNVDAKILNKTPTNQTHRERIIHHDQVWFNPGMQEDLT